MHVFGKELLSIKSYTEGYRKAPEKVRQDFTTLVDFTKSLNARLHSYKITENRRALLLSSVLIALENEAFRAGYAKQKTPRALAYSLYQTVFDEFLTREVPNLAELQNEYGFLKVERTLTTDTNALKTLISDVDLHLNQFKKTHEFFDVLGEMYIEFLRYANSDKGLGIVLTPSHVRNFFVDLAEIDKNSIVYDNCAGTGGFLISALEKMVQLAAGNQKQIDQIKNNQILGVEYQSHIYALAVSNMYIHGDGKSNLLYGDCFDSSILTKIRQKKPTIGLLNPPYKAQKKTDTEELEFVLNNLEVLEKNGTCVALLPMNSALATKGYVLDLKRQLLQNHTLEAVLSLPAELFVNSKVQVVSCALVFRAHKPHSPTKKTFFGFFKDDGFVKRKNQGRIDVYGTWPAIRKTWLDAYVNRKDIPGLSVTQSVSFQDEWCPEAYMKTDYTQLTRDHFIQTLVDYSAFLFRNRLRKQVQENSYNESFPNKKKQTHG